MRWRWFLRVADNPEPIGPATQYVGRSGGYLRAAPDHSDAQPAQVTEPVTAERSRARWPENRGSHWRSV
ncbi:hypothetical protein BDK92_1728 [Micromonospora pisi]|uniref:Uncharacterized protein n=1 Tax=Micromonospora pisi TaxID=589240 RepID=A0A495JGH9_9ACTN|nr:hypothetical protein [Micromonospora pisi]RKR87452.1 hypothetical protein BDK92_1728 [Micromonospora pisi]